MTLGYQEKIPGALYDYGGAVFNLQHKDFGGKQDNTWDAAFIAAIEALPADGGIIVIPPSADIYMINSIRFGGEPGGNVLGKPNITVQAYGARIKKFNGSEGTQYHMFSDREAQCDNFRWYGGDIDLSGSFWEIGSTVSFWFSIRSKGLRFRDIYVHDGVEEGIKLYRASDVRIEDSHFARIRNDGVQIHCPAADGFLGTSSFRIDQGSENIFVLNNLIEDIDDGTFGALDGQGVAVHGTHPTIVTKKIHVKGNTCVRCIRGILAEFNQPGNPGINLKFDGNIISDSISHGINLTGCRASSVNDNELYDIGSPLTVSSETFGIVLSGSGDPLGYNNVCTGNTIVDSRTPNYMNYGLIVKQQVFAVAKNNHIYGPTIKSILVEWGTNKVVQSIVENTVVPQSKAALSAGVFALPDAAWTNFDLDTEIYDYDTMWDIAHPERFYIKTPGQYLVVADISIPISAVGYRGIRILSDDGTTSIVEAERLLNTTTADDASGSLSAIITVTPAQVDTGRWARIQLWQNSGGSVNLANAARNNVSVTYVGGNLKP